MFRFALALSITGCAAEPSGPVAPSNLEVSLLGAGAHLIWDDNSDDEIEFVIFRQEMGADADEIELSRVPFDTVSYHDEPITSRATYLYTVAASNEDGDTASNTATFVAP